MKTVIVNASPGEGKTRLFFTLSTLPCDYKPVWDDAEIDRRILVWRAQANERGDRISQRAAVAALLANPDCSAPRRKLWERVKPLIPSGKPGPTRRSHRK
jgi:hypothetical protein